MSQEPPPTSAPSVPLFREIGATEKTYAYRPLTPYTWAVFGLAGLNGLSLAVLIVGLAMRLVVLNGMQNQSFAALNEATFVDALVNDTGAVLLLARFAALIAGGFWIYNAACNVRGLGARGLDVSPGWSVGFYAIPIAAWFKPFQAIEEIEKASRAPLNWKREPTPLLLRFWWTAWLLANIGGTVLNLTVNGSSMIGDLAAVNVGLLAVSTMDLASIVLFLLVVRRIAREQSRTRAGLNDVAQVFA